MTIKPKKDKNRSIDDVGKLNYIEHTVLTVRGAHVCSMNFFQARDFAFEVGLLKVGNVKKVNILSRNTEKSKMIIDLAFLNALMENALNATEDIRILKEELESIKTEEVKAMIKKLDIK